jgi:hypothetical protein
MSKKLLTVVLEELVVDTNGDLAGERPSDDPASGARNNALTASLRYPRSGAPQIISTRQYDLVNGKPATLLDASNPDEFFDPLLFREEVLDRTVLNLKVTDRDAAAGFEKFFLAVFSTVLGAGFSVVTGGLSSVLGAVAGFGVEHMKDSICGAGNETITVIGKAAPLALVMDELSPTATRVHLALTAPIDVIKCGLVIDPETSKPVAKDYTLLKAGAANGYVILRISAVAV